MTQKQIVLSSRAKLRLQALLNYLETEWSQKVKSDFIKKLDRSINQIANHPLSGKEASKKKGVYQIIVTKQTSLFYRVKENEIQIITLEDNRMNPNKLKL